MTAGEVMDRVSSRELTEWAAYERVAGRLGPERGDFQAALTAYYVVRALGAKNVRFDKLVPQWDRPPQRWQDMATAMKAVTLAVGGEVVSPN